MNAEFAARLLVELVVAILAGGGVAGLILLPQRKRHLAAQTNDTNATADARIMGAAASLVEQAGTQVPALLERITRLEASNERILDEQAAERAEVQAWRQYGALQSAWAAAAVRAIRELGGTIEDPPTSPVIERRAPTAPL